MKRPKFFMVKGSGPTAMEHENLDIAREEAARLARKHPGEVFFVMEAVEMHRTIDVEVVDLREASQDLPF